MINLNFVLKNRGAIIPYFIEQDKEAHMSLKTILEMKNDIYSISIKKVNYQNLNCF